MKKLLWIIIIVVLVVGGVYLYQNKTGKSVVPAVTTEQKQDQAAESVKQAAEDVSDAAKATAEDVKTDVNNAVNGN